MGHWGPGISTAIASFQYLHFMTKVNTLQVLLVRVSVTLSWKQFYSIDEYRYVWTWKTNLYIFINSLPNPFIHSTSVHIILVLHSLVENVLNNFVNRTLFSAVSQCLEHCLV